MLRPLLFCALSALLSGFGFGQDTVRYVFEGTLQTAAPGSALFGPARTGDPVKVTIVMQQTPSDFTDGVEYASYSTFVTTRIEIGPVVSTELVGGFLEVQNNLFQSTGLFCEDMVNWFMDGTLDHQGFVIGANHFLDNTSACPVVVNSLALPLSLNLGGGATSWLSLSTLEGDGILAPMDTITVSVEPASFPSSCVGDGGDQMGCTECPCLNNAPSGALGGCLNSAGASARLVATGSESLLAGDLRFEVEGAVPDSFAVLTSGAAIAPTNPQNPCFGLDSGVPSLSLDGLRCAVQSTLRHGGRPVAADGTVGMGSTNGWGPPNGPSGGVGQAAGFPPGETRHFQVFYRELPGTSCLTEQNTTQAVTVTFTN